jgi:hypothetical protein
MLKLMLVLFLGMAGLSLQAQEKPEGLFIHSKAPDFKLKDQNGKDVALKDVRVLIAAGT